MERHSTPGTLILKWERPAGLLARIVLILLCAVAFAWSDVQIATFKDPSIKCDYLVIAPSQFILQATRLADHRNAFANDDVTNARVVDLARIYTEFTTGDTTKTFEAIHGAIVWAYNNWAMPLRYVVLLGDDSAGRQESNPYQWNRGPMPSYTFKKIVSQSKLDPITNKYMTTYDTSYTESDLFYLVPLPYDSLGVNSDPLIPVAIGRGPCETATQCSLYVDRIIRFDQTTPKAPWMNSTILLADDAYQGTRPDAIDHLASAEYVAGKYLHDDFLQKIYFADYDRNDQDQNVLAGDCFFSAVNSGAFTTVFFGHGAPAVLSDELTIQARQAFRLHNGEMRGVFYSFSCSNDGFNVPFARSMCKQFLFADSGGYLGYVASTTEQFNDENRQFAADIFSIRDSTRSMSLGRVFSKAVQNNNSSIIRFYNFLGDPALQPFSTSDTLSLVVNGESVSCRAKAGKIGAGSNFAYRVVRGDTIVPVGSPQYEYIRDTVLDSGSGLCSGSSFSVMTSLRQPGTRLIAYAWNDTAEARGCAPLFSRLTAYLASGKGHNRSVFAVRRDVVYFDGTSGATSIAVRTIDGRQVFRAPVSANAGCVRLDGARLPAGLYIVEARKNTGGTSGQIPWVRAR